MKGVLVDENLPASLVPILRSAGIECFHVTELALAAHPDSLIWSTAIARELAILTKDADYVDLVLASRAGKVVLVATGNLRLSALKEHIASRTDQIREFLGSESRIESI
jgi:predicted nuclease of predicted toxin-antitoxin system